MDRFPSFPAGRCRGLGWVCALAVACATVAGTGRHQVRLISAETEIRLGEEAWAEALDAARLVSAGPDFEKVQRVGTRVATAARRLYPDPSRDFAWEFVLIEDPENVNAWALPGGKCAVYTGLLSVAAGEDELAVVLGHEVAHAVAHHGAERISQGMIAQGVFWGADLYLGSRGTDPDRHGRILNALGLATSLGVLLPYSRKHESEADELGLYLAAAAGYDPRVAPGLWERMAGSEIPVFLSTHPGSGTRIRRLREHMPEALGYLEQARQRQARPES